MPSSLPVVQMYWQRLMQFAMWPLFELAPEKPIWSRICLGKRVGVIVSSVGLAASVTSMT